MVAPPRRRNTPCSDVAVAYVLRKCSVALQRAVTKWPLVNATIKIKGGPDPQLTLRHACDYRIRPWRPNDGRDGVLLRWARTADRAALLHNRADGGATRRCRPVRSRDRLGSARRFRLRRRLSRWRSCSSRRPAR